VYPAPDAGREWRDPILRDPVAIRLRDRGRPVLTAAGDADPEPDRDRDAHRDSDTDAGTDTETDT
jgi:hypothetical protein